MLTTSFILLAVLYLFEPGFSSTTKVKREGEIIEVIFFMPSIFLMSFSRSLTASLFKISTDAPLYEPLTVITSNSKLGKISLGVFI